PAPNINRINAPRATIQQYVGKSACRGADVEADAVPRIEDKAVKRRGKLDAASRNIRMCGSRPQRCAGRDFVGSLAHDLLVGGDQACLDRGLRLGTAFKDAAFDQQTVSADTCACHEPDLRNNVPFTVVTWIGREHLHRPADICLRRNSMARKYSRGASRYVERAMKKRKKGTLRSGRSGRKVKSRKQAIAIGLSEARKKGKKVPR